MFHEIKNVMQKLGDDKSRRWFEDVYFDLIVWYNHDNTIYGFQLCYDRFGHEHAITWKNDHPFSHDIVDGTPEHSLKTPILLPDGKVPFDNVINKFIKSSKSLEKEISELVLSKLIDFKRHHEKA